MSRACLVIVAALGAALGSACGGKAEAPPAAVPEPLADAAVDGVSIIGGYDPQSGMHLDDDVPHAAVRPAAKRAGRTIEIMLRSTPTGARVHVDGNFINTTPTMWTGETGEHEFTFVLPGHALARYRFHAIATGIVHARLDPVIEERDVGRPPPEVVPPRLAPPATLVSPDAGVPRGPTLPRVDAAPVAPVAPAIDPPVAPSDSTPVTPIPLGPQP